MPNTRRCLIFALVRGGPRAGQRLFRRPMEYFRRWPENWRAMTFAAGFGINCSTACRMSQWLPSSPCRGGNTSTKHRQRGVGRAPGEPLRRPLSSDPLAGPGWLSDPLVHGTAQACLPVPQSPVPNRRPAWPEPALHFTQGGSGRGCSVDPPAVWVLRAGLILGLACDVRWTGQQTTPALFLGRPTGSHRRGSPWPG